MPKVEGVEKVIAALKKRGMRWLADSQQAAGDRPSKHASVIVGYTQAYALYVHEDMEAFHRVGQAQYLRQPARQYAKELAELAVKAVRNGATVSQALLVAGLRLQRESQLLVPVDTSALKASAFTKLE